MAKPSKVANETADDLAPWEREGAAAAEVAQLEETLKAMPPEVQTLIDWLAARATETDEDTFAVLASAIAQMATAENPDQVLAAANPLHGKDFLDKPFLCMGFTVREGDFEDGSPFYAVLDVALDMGATRRVVTCGGWRVLAQLMMLDKMGDWPQNMVIRGKRTKAGFTVLSLERPTV